jgi:hypothetical protein
MSVDKDVHLPPPSAAVAQNPAEQIQLLGEAAVEKVISQEVAVTDGADVLPKKKKPDAGLGNYFVNMISNVGVSVVLMLPSEYSPMARSWTHCSWRFASSLPSAQELQCR